MDVSLLVPLFVPWLAKVFPSLSDYTEYVAPALMAILSVLGIFTNLLPEPGSKYPVPDVTQLEAELKGNALFILKMAMFTRSLVVGINWFIGTAPYAWFHKGITAITKIIPIKWIKKTK